MRISPFKKAVSSQRTLKTKNLSGVERAAPTDRVTLTGKLGRIAKGAIIGAGIGAAATALGVVGAMTGGTGALLGIGGAVALGVGLAHKLDMEVPSSYLAPERAGREKTFYGGTAGFMGGAFGAAVMGMGLLTGAGAVAAAGVGIGYAATL
ncbi:MAG TPA: hypothetical protein EYO33_12130, partial [Phycisphaerales bacterium]|nr:hypothetical protein [Phycisphaerales bacterium]